MVGEMTSSETANAEDVCLELPAPSGWKKKVVHSLVSFSLKMVFSFNGVFRTYCLLIICGLFDMVTVSWCSFYRGFSA